MATDVVIVSYTVKRGALTNLEHVLEDLTPGTIGYGNVVLKTSAVENYRYMDSVVEAVSLAIKNLEIKPS